uniref:hypothetical protein n=1 Tax=uncultured Altererythrobacter sp. TaxID=500840 RepID=UPI0026155175|nr:hypothetical protein [uncultured Altererythrobacter sp.]
MLTISLLVQSAWLNIAFIAPQDQVIDVEPQVMPAFLPGAVVQDTAAEGDQATGETENAEAVNGSPPEPLVPLPEPPSPPLVAQVESAPVSNMAIMPAPYEVCGDEDKPCFRVIGNPGDEFWAIPKDTFDAYQSSQAPPRATMSARIDAASSFAFHNWPIESIGEEGHNFPELGELGIIYLVVPKCYDRSDAGHFRYKMRREMKLEGQGEKIHRLRCSWD